MKPLTYTNSMAGARLRTPRCVLVWHDVCSEEAGATRESAASGAAGAQWEQVPAMIRHQNARSLYAYWRSLRKNGRPPARRDINPRAMSPFLSTVFMLERSELERVIFRLAGTSVCALFGRELRDADISDLWDESHRPHVKNLTESVFASADAGVIASLARTESGAEIDLEWLFLPIFAPSGDLDRLIGCVNATSAYSGRARSTIVNQEVFLIRQPDILDFDTKD